MNASEYASAQTDYVNEGVKRAQALEIVDRPDLMKGENCTRKFSMPIGAPVFTSLKGLLIRQRLNCYVLS